jgi:hypothetical protein
MTYTQGGFGKSYALCFLRGVGPPAVVPFTFGAGVGEDGYRDRGDEWYRPCGCHRAR